MLTPRIAAALRLPPASVAGCLELLAAGNTVPFIARYRKERTHGLDEVQIRAVQEQSLTLTELLTRRDTVLRSIEAQGQLTAVLKEAIEACWDRAALEDLYLPYRPRRKTRASVAREAGLSALADIMMAQALQQGTPGQVAQPFVASERGIDTPEKALQGACDILAERFSEDAALRGRLREHAFATAVLASRAHRGADPERLKHFSDYTAYRESVCRVPSHRFLAVMRGSAEKVLSVGVEQDDVFAVAAMARAFLRGRSIFEGLLRQTIDDAFKRLVGPSIENEVLAGLKERADREAVKVFSDNLRHLLLAPPSPGVVVMGVDPGLRTGCKMAVLDATGKVLATATVQPHQGSAARLAAGHEVQQLVADHRVAVAAVGNGTASRETLAFLREALDGLLVKLTAVSEAGASVYSASDLARAELPGLDVTLRGAVSIGRRFQDPLAELVKVPPESIGVGQYQHDVDQALLGRALGGVVEDCVNAVGVEVNTASVSLLTAVCGLGHALASAVVRYREEHGPFRRRADLMAVPRLGARAFEQAAGFLRIREGSEPLDATAVHPERYGLVRRMARALGLSVPDLLGDRAHLDRIDPHAYESDDCGIQTVCDVLAELRRPGRDPRGESVQACFRDDVHEVKDLTVGMVLQGVVTNVAAFGAFVDVGVHRDGLVHVSRMSDAFVRDPGAVVHAGQVVMVKVVEIDLDRNRLSFSMKPSDIRNAL